MESGRLIEESDLPLRVEPSSPGERSAEGLQAWVRDQRTWLEEELRRHGGILLRGFQVEDAGQFEAFCRAFDPELLAYVGGESPRTAVAGRVYTSTEYPSHLEISLHNEMSYARDWPRHLFFFCDVAPDEGGETQIADGRRVLAALDPDVRRRFAEKQVMYVRNLQDGRGLGKSWQETFETDDRDRVEEHCRASGVEFEWTDSGLRTVAVRPAVIRHPETGDEVWFTQVDKWHV